MPVGAAREHAGSAGIRVIETRERETMISRIVLAIGAVALAATAVTAQQQDPIKARQAIMKANGQHAQLGTKMSKGEEPFTVEKGKKVFATYQDVAKAHALFPESSKTGETAALPAIWENKADFEARLTKLVNEAKAAEAKVSDLDSFKAEFTEVQKNCGGCHQTYRKRQS
jgi:cytochrome c556